MQATRGPTLDQLKEKYIRSGLLNSRENTGSRRRSSQKRTSVSRPTTNSRRSSSQNAAVFSNRQSFRDIVLRATEHKPFLERLDSRSRNRLVGLGHQARLEKFRNIASRWKNKAKAGGGGITTLPEVDYEEEMPDKPRFCATLSTEAQYAIFKGYEDVLVDKISTSLTPSENAVHIKRIPSAAPKDKSNSTSKSSSLPIIDTRPSIILISSSRSKNDGSDVGENVASARLRRFREQRYMSAHFKQAMNILDELKRCSSDEISTAVKPPERNVSTAQNDICRQYHAWSQRWAKQFEFSC
jgi:hypothetical protein